MSPIDGSASARAGLLSRVRRFVDEWVIPVEANLLRLDHLPQLRALMAEAKRLGLWGLGQPAAPGGGGLSMTDQVLVNEAIGRSEPASTVLGFHTVDDIGRIQRFGTAEQQERWLPPLLSGDIFSGLALTEPAVAGSDPQIMRSPAHFDGDGWVLDGRKWFTTWADRAAFFLVVASTDPTAELARRFSAFLVPADSPGLRLERTIPVMGDTDSIYGELALDGVRVPSEALLGPRGGGLDVAHWRSNATAILDAIRWVGRAQRAFEMMGDRANRRWSHGSLLGEQGEIRRYIAESAAEIHAARLMALDAARASDEGQPTEVRSSLVQLAAAHALQRVTDRAIQVHGALGVSDELPLERMYRQARLARLHSEPDEIHRMNVARELLADPASAPWRDHAATPTTDKGSTSMPPVRRKSVPSKHREPRLAPRAVATGSHRA